MNASQVAAAKTAELLAFYNANSGKAPVARFSDRASAERRVNALIAELAAKAPAPAPVKATSKKARYSNNRAPGNNAAGVAASWTRDEVRAARAARHAVVVAGKGQFKSVAQAFKALGLESKLIIRTRAKLVAEGSTEVGGFNFRLA